MSSKKGRNRSSISLEKDDNPTERPEKAETYDQPTPLQYEYESDDGLSVQIDVTGLEVSRDYQISEDASIEVSYDVGWSPLDWGIEVDEEDLSVSGEIGIPGDILGFGGGVTIDLATGAIEGGEASIAAAGIEAEVSVSEDGCLVSVGLSIFGAGIAYQQNNCSKEEDDEGGGEVEDSQGDADTGGELKLNKWKNPPSGRGTQCPWFFSHWVTYSEISGSGAVFGYYQQTCIGLGNAGGIMPGAHREVGKIPYGEPGAPPRSYGSMKINFTGFVSHLVPEITEDLYIPWYHSYVITESCAYHSTNYYAINGKPVPVIIMSGESCGICIRNRGKFKKVPDGYPPVKPKPDCCSASTKLLREIHEALNCRELLDKGLSVPNYYAYPDTDPKRGTIFRDYLSLQAFQFKHIENRGIHQIDVEVSDVNAAQSGDQTVKMTFLNGSAALKQLLEFSLENKGDSATRLNLQVRTAIASAQTLNVTTKIFRLARAMIDFMGIPLREKKGRLRMPFDISLGNRSKGFDPKKLQKEIDKNAESPTEATLPQFLQDADQPYIYDEFNHKYPTLVEIIKNIGGF